MQTYSDIPVLSELEQLVMQDMSNFGIPISGTDDELKSFYASYWEKRLD
ncbi:MAG: hypothetical protein QGH83_14755 [Candidatus Pacebacteria bacterium]|jgi:hypothetical protein|nr:hypothetical protein [Candidatus Paceibacterota bacterium]|tara:strand:+ start:1228 stop:1374 length:147 start_codon:yes stop_codon:yes gene_type:complete